MPPTVSIIVPVYNMEPYLEECLQSVISQSVKNIEVLIVDDGSNDDSLKIARRLSEKDNRLKVIVQENRGLGAARNTGMDYAAGRYISFIDSDDFVSFDFIESMLVRALETKAPIVTIGQKQFNDDGYVKVHTSYKRSELKNIDMHCAYCARQINPAVTNKLYLRSILKDHRFDESLYYEDELFNFKVMLKANHIAFAEGEKYYYRIRNSSITQKITEKHVNDLYKIAVEINDFLTAKCIYESILKNIYLEFLSRFLWHCMERIFKYYSNEGRKKFIPFVEYNVLAFLENNPSVRPFFGEGWENILLSDPERSFEMGWEAFKMFRWY